MASSDKAESVLRAHVTSVKEDLMTGVSFMIPFVTIGGIFMAIGFGLSEFGMFPGSTETVFSETGSLPWYFAQIGNLGLTVMIPILGGYIAYAIADKPGLAPGFMLSYILQQGMLIDAAGAAVNLNADGATAGFLGAIVAGLLAGYVARFLKNLDVPAFIEPMMPVLIIPVLTTLVLAPVMLFVLGVPIALANESLTGFLESMRGGQALIVGAILGGMMAFDMGGPVNKVAYVFATGLIGEGVTGPMAAVMIGGMIPPIGLAISNFISPHKYAAEMYENAKSGLVLGFSFITEGAIPYAAADPIRVIPSIVAGSAVGGAAAMTLDVTMPAPHGGIFVIPLSNSPFMFLACILLGSLVTAAVALLLKPDFEDRVEAGDAGATPQADD
ncbi:PTS fructose transporter subunit IIC [Halostella salina]|uniref:PTS fructose transporter subunit IIC n=1 Tax=Halostella salina TaxID=1547897 RepID=UPI000EF820CD|nr:PTS fructose transporter subunit IIC [Halostella salina]